MLLIDNRMGSGDLAARIAATPEAPEAQLTRLEFGDVAFIGNGADGDVLVGVEVKTVNDLVNCIMDGRYAAHQLPGMLDTYGKFYTLIEGEYRGNQYTGELEAPRWSQRSGKVVWGPIWRGKKRLSYKALIGWVASVEEFTGMRFKYSQNRADTVRVLLGLYNWWQKDYDSHKSLKVLHDKSKKFSLSPSRKLTNCVEVKPTLTMEIAAKLDGIGWDKALMVGAHFKTPKNMVLASKEQWLEIDGIGELLAERNVRLLTEE